MASVTPWWLCDACGYPNKPRAVTNSLNLPLPTTLLDATWRGGHCEQCGAPKGPNALDYTPRGS